MPVRGYFPFVAVEDRPAGVWWGAQLAWAGSWQMEAYRRDDQLSLSGGLADREFGHWLKSVVPGEEFASPLAYVSTVKGDLDDLCQRLASIRFRCDALKKTLSTAPLGESKASLEKIGGDLGESVDRARMLARGLAPVALEKSGLVSALEELTASTQATSKVKCSFRAKEKISVLDPIAATHLFRIAQEAITNALKHGRPSQIRVSLQKGKDKNILMIQDDGDGFSPRRAEGVPEGMGLRTISYRATMISGTVAAVESAGVVGVARGDLMKQHQIVEADMKVLSKLLVGEGAVLLLDGSYIRREAYQGSRQKLLAAHNELNNAWLLLNYLTGNPGSHRKEQALFFVQQSQSVSLSNSAAISLAGQLGHSVAGGTFNFRRFLMERATTGGEFTGANFTVVPYKSGSEGMTAVLSGNVDGTSEASTPRIATARWTMSRSEGAPAW